MTSCEIGCHGDGMQRREPDAGDISEAESEDVEAEEVAGEEATKRNY
jgi:hypothetical protein